MEFLLKPHTKKILEGRGLILKCCAPFCVHQPKESSEHDPLWGREIKVSGYGDCPRCGHKTDISYFVFDEECRKSMPYCEKCGKQNIKVIYTQNVVSKHRKSNHYYYHKECYDMMFVGDTGLVNKRKYKTRYAGARGGGIVVYLPFDPRKGVCAACGKSKAKKEIKLTCLHHWMYAYKPATVQKNPILVLDNTSELCYACHLSADGARNLMKMNELSRIVKILKLMPQDLNIKFTNICGEWLKSNGENNGKRKHL